MKFEEVASFFDPVTFTMTYVVWHPQTRDAVVIDSVIDFDFTTQLTSLGSINQVANFLKFKKLNLIWVLDTHAHADHLSAAREFKSMFPGARWAVSARMREVFATFKKAFGWPANIDIEKLGVDRWLEDGEEVAAGLLRIQAIATPGHTPACMTYKIGQKLFTGDAIFMPDGGVGRCDFPGGDASALYDSIWTKLYSMPSEYKVYVGHDYQPNGRPLAFSCLLGDQKAGNIHLSQSTSREDFIKFRTARDKTLKAPRLLEPSLDWNLGAHQVVKRA